MCISDGCSWCCSLLEHSGLVAGRVMQAGRRVGGGERLRGSDILTGKVNQCKTL